MKVTQITTARFHHFHLARQLEKFGLLDKIWSGYPKSKLKDEKGINRSKIKSFPWFLVPYLISLRFDTKFSKKISNQLAWWAQDLTDRFIKTSIKEPTILIAMSGGGLHSGVQAQKLGGKYFCDRASTHILYQNKIMTEEYKRWGLMFQGIDPRIINKELKEYEISDGILVPTEFVKRSFVEMGVPESKIYKVMYGARLDRFSKVGNPPTDKFRILWVGGISIRKGFLDLLEAFKLLNHKQKELFVIGFMPVEMKDLIHSYDLSNVSFVGTVPNVELPRYYSTSHVFVLPSIEEGLAYVQGEAMACGCPVIASSHSGSEDLFTHGVEGFIVPIRSPVKICEYLQMIADDPILREKMSESAQERVRQLGGWDLYGDNIRKIISDIR